MQHNAGTITKYIVSALYDGEVVAAFSFEAISAPETAADRFLNFFLRRRSAWFNLEPEDIELILKTKKALTPVENSDAHFAYEVFVADKPLVMNFFPMKYVI